MAPASARRSTIRPPLSPRETQYFEMLGSRSIVHHGWKATTDHISVGVIDEEEAAIGSRVFDDDHWAVFDLRTDFSESTDVAAEHPDVARRLQERWLTEAGRNQVLPVDDTFVNRIGALVPPAWPPGTDRTFRPGGGPVFDESVPMLWGGFRMTAVADVTDEPDGVLVALGDWNGGYALFVADGHLVFTFCRAGDVLEVVGDRPVPTGRQSLGVHYGLLDGQRGAFTLLHGDAAVGRLEFDGMLPLAIQHGGAGLRLGHDVGLPVSTRYRPRPPGTATSSRSASRRPGRHHPTPPRRSGPHCTATDARRRATRRRTPAPRAAPPG